jgi:pimeloyl-ACP methyl ester carboxylesterase
MLETQAVRSSSTISEDGTVIAYHSVGTGPGMVIVGGVLSDGENYLQLAEALGDRYTVHVMERRGRPGSGPQRPGHSIEEECADLIAVATATGSRSAFGHSFGGLVVLETARRRPLFDELFVYEPGVPVRGGLTAGWLDGYQRRLDRGDRRGAFAWMVKQAGFAPRPLRLAPLWYVSLMLRIAIRGPRWRRIDRLLEANLIEHRLQAALDAPALDRFATVAAHTILMAGTKSPAALSGPLLNELANRIPNPSVETLPGLGHLAPEDDPARIARAMHAHASCREPEQGRPNAAAAKSEPDQPGVGHRPRSPAESNHR